MDVVLDCKGLKCPQPVLKIAIKATTMQPGSTLTVSADCPSFPDDVKKWCESSGKVLLSCIDHGSYRTATIQF